TGPWKRGRTTARLTSGPTAMAAGCSSSASTTTGARRRPRRPTTRGSSSSRTSGPRPYPAGTASRRALTRTGPDPAPTVSGTSAAAFLGLFRSDGLHQRLEPVGAAGDPFLCALQSEDLGGTLVLAVHRQHQFREPSRPLRVEVLRGREHAVAERRRRP